MMTAEQIVEMIENDMEHESFGLRADRPGLEIGQALENSHQWYQDWQDWWGEKPEEYDADPDHPYNRDMGCWDDGELDGVCTIGISCYSTIERGVAKALELIRAYMNDGRKVYLVGGSYSMGGNDIGESIIADAEVVALVD